MCDTYAVATPPDTHRRPLIHSATATATLHLQIFLRVPLFLSIILKSKDTDPKNVVVEKSLKHLYFVF